MAARKQAAPRKQAARPRKPADPKTPDVEPAGIPYEIDGKRVTLAEYRAHTRKERRARVVAELRGESGDA